MNISAAQEYRRGEGCRRECAGGGVWSPGSQASTHHQEWCDCPWPEKTPPHSQTHSPQARGERMKHWMGSYWPPVFGGLNVVAEIKGRGPVG